MKDFARKLVAWQRRSGRHDLPWQRTRDPYRVWLSEIMLQQTQVRAVIPYYERFLARFPDVDALAAADEDAVLRLWSGLGYYARGRNLHKAAVRVAAMGGFPDTVDGLEALPGIGRSTAGAIAVFAFGRRAPILDGNVKRVLSRCFGETDRLWELAGALVPVRNVETYTQSLMDLGATVCTRSRPACERCPLAADCVALREDRVAALPARKARRPLPQRSATWLVLLDRGEVLLERRPSQGLWGGLWTFPELLGASPSAQCRERHGCTIAKPEKLAPLEHGFTHFRLAVQPLLCKVRSRRRGTSGDRATWVGLADAVRAAVPVPVRKVLEGLGAG